MSNGVYGRAATGLTNDPSFAANASVAKIGAAGEVRTAEILNGFGLKAAVLNDLRVPIPGFSSNIDHVVVSGKRVLVLDTKVWQPGFYWTLFGVNRRGGTRVDHTAKDQAWLQQALITYLRGTGAEVLTPAQVVWSSRKNAVVTLLLLRVPGARLIHGEHLVGFVKRFIGRTPADPVITMKLNELCVRAKPRAAAAGRPRTPQPAGPDPFDAAPRFTTTSTDPFN